jgi:hypothetical protein
VKIKKEMKKTEDNISMMKEELEMMYFDEGVTTQGNETPRGESLGATLGADLQNESEFATTPINSGRGPKLTKEEIEKKLE